MWHRYSPETLIDAQADDVEGALWAAARALADRAALLQRLAEQGERRGQARSARRFRRQAQAASEQADIVRQALTGAARTTLRRVSDGDDSNDFDFTGYKRTTIQRRIAKRMAAVGVERYDDYLDYLELHGEEFAELFNTLLINATGFFRDPQTWEYLATDAVPQLLKSNPGGAPIRVWCAGCASGEEPYTVAMVLARVLGDDAFRARVKIYATDVDEEALGVARHGAYAPQQIEDVPHEALERFFEHTDQRYVFRKDLRRYVIFGRNDLVQDAPISRIDLLICRNTLMYFTAEAQA